MKKTQSKTTPKKQPAASKKTVPKRRQSTRRKQSITTALIKHDAPLVPIDGQGAIRSLELYIERRKSILEFIKDSLVEGKDFGFTHKNAVKQEIWKSGCEKVWDWLGLATPKFFPDHESWAMLGNPAGTIVLKCYLVRRANMKALVKDIKSIGVAYEELVYRQYAESEGRGAASLEESRIFDANACVKKCEIRAVKDATLRLGLSGEFGQDEAEFITAQEQARKTVEEIKEGQRELQQPRRMMSEGDRAMAETAETEMAAPDKIIELASAAYAILDSGKLPAVAAKKFRTIIDNNVRIKNEIALDAALKALTAQAKK